MSWFVKTKMLSYLTSWVRAFQVEGAVSTVSLRWDREQTEAKWGLIKVSEGRVVRYYIGIYILLKGKPLESFDYENFEFML